MELIFAIHCAEVANLYLSVYFIALSEGVQCILNVQDERSEEVRFVGAGHSCPMECHTLVTTKSATIRESFLIAGSFYISMYFGEDSSVFRLACIRSSPSFGVIFIRIKLPYCNKYLKVFPKISVAMHNSTLLRV